MRFKERNSLCNIDVQREVTSVVAEAAASYQEDLSKMPSATLHSIVSMSMKQPSTG